jgi:hypothetical protein
LGKWEKQYLQSFPHEWLAIEKTSPPS